MTRADRIARPVAVLVSLVIVGFVLLAVFPRSHPPAGQCGGRTGRARGGAAYSVALQADGDNVVSTVDFDGRLWRAIGDRVTRNGLVAASATTLAGGVALVNAQEATFSSPAAYATLLPLTKADGCPTTDVVRSGPAMTRLR
jgi:hypothetical protein